MKKMKNKITITLLIGLTLFSCADLDVSNTNAPDQERALAKPADVESLIRSTFLTFWQGTHLSGNSWFIATQGDANSCSWGNWGMRELSSEPRIAHNNSPAWGYAGAADDLWYGLYAAISSAKDGLSALSSGITLNSESDSNADIRAKIFAKWVMGISHAMVALHHDQGFIITEETDFSQGTPELSDYNAMMAAAITMLEGVISDANANSSVNIPEDWLHISSFTMADLAMVTHSLIARYKAGVARNATERAGADWAGVRSHAEKGAPFAPVGDTQYWWSYTHYYGGAHSYWTRADYRFIGPSDQSGRFQTWLGDNSAATVQGRSEIFIVTDDKRIVGGGAAEDSLEQTPGKYIFNTGYAFLIPSRGTYHRSYYLINKTAEYAAIEVAPMKDLVQQELDLLIAEGYLRAGDAASAATQINLSRVGIGEMTASAASDGLGSDTDAPSALDGASLWAKYKYEKLMEGNQTNPWLNYTDRRGWTGPIENDYGGGLLPGTPVHYPLPGKELEVLLMDPYTFGGQDNLSDPGTASHKMREGSGFRNRGFFIEFKERDRSINKANLK
jgi:hypothetical protein